LVQASTGGERGAGNRFLEAASTNGIDLSGFYCSIVEGEPSAREAALAVPGAGRTAVLFTSTPDGEERVSELARVIERAARAHDGVKLAQTLLTTEESVCIPAYLEAGFEDLAELAYLRRPMPKAGQYEEPTAWPEGIRLEPGNEVSDADFLAGLQASYVDTLDCPRLCGLRDAQDVLDSHRATGIFDASLWTLIRFQDRPVGAMLLNSCPDQNAVELVYVGIAPEVRGIGLGSQLMRFALWKLGGRSEGFLTCAVDLANKPAMKLYDAFGFVEFGRRRALVCGL
ncbi:MAG: GNAT family N-acetyltransferase, partial [Planctomycetota bacterium]